jgi:hypothetical protein
MSMRLNMISNHGTNGWYVVNGSLVENVDHLRYMRKSMNVIRNADVIESTVKNTTSFALRRRFESAIA